MDVQRRIAMSQEIAQQWLEARVTPEYRLEAHPPIHGAIRDLPTILRAWRDNRMRVAKTTSPLDLGVRILGSGALVVWSSDYPKMKVLANWLTRRGYEVDGVW